MSTPNDELANYLTRPRLRSPRAAGIAGLVFSLFMSLSMVLVQRAFPSDPADFSGNWLNNSAAGVSITIAIVPIAGIAFLWFMGVARELLGHLEDQFFSTVFTGSGLLFLAMIFVWAAIGGSILAGYATDPVLVIEGGFYMMGRLLMRQLFGVFGMAMAGVYVFSSGTIWFRTEAVMRWLVLVTWGTAVILWFSAILPWWLQLSFPAWVFLVSVYILRENLSGRTTTGNEH